MFFIMHVCFNICRTSRTSAYKLHVNEPGDVNFDVLCPFIFKCRVPLLDYLHCFAHLPYNKHTVETNE